MEVHHHAHTERKKWTHYFWEFLMLFLAVFCGFLAENQREHYVEHQRENQYMRSMLQDLQIDLKNIEISQNEKERMVQFGDSLTEMYINGSYKENCGHFYYYARNFSTYQNLFIMTDGTLTQLKNSGGLRLIRKSEIVNSLQAYDNVFNQFRLSQEREDRYLMDYRDVMAKIFDIRIFNTMVITYPDINMPAGNPPLFNEDKQLINEMLIKVHIAKRNKLASLRYISRLKENALSLIGLIKKEYHLQ
jgi:hypothetical protein